MWILGDSNTNVLRKTGLSKLTNIIEKNSSRKAVQKLKMKQRVLEIPNPIGHDLSDAKFFVYHLSMPRTDKISEWDVNKSKN